MRRFSEVIDDLELVDLSLLGGNFTWSGGSHNHYQARLDRFLVSQDWLDHVGKVEQLKLPKPTLDHAPILELHPLKKNERGKASTQSLEQRLFWEARG